ncbi:quinone-dependent dihydroorotate dehydrogenase [Ostreibacterium oceani]|uniref:Dihydroorotate dehydrogenase (quinone) n=1 Tax=Ostreibacterium oceani TaxID=2654998 RepID=A0A6N7EY97_9GAMM|nr:quinone-dependent dihydroorotate dehydrogenase [Ostreibacterium oceani]MPV86359.1 quinone-dependent dihydroorotate dehydrogenase [Ostreibacterium oceani]
MLYTALRPLLFSLDPEKAHHLALNSLDKLACVLPKPNLETDPVTVMGLRFPNRVGLAAGLDKDGAHVASLAKFGFGFIEVGTVTPLPQSGNPKPRLFRLPSQQALINRMGFNNHGAKQLVDNVSRVQFDGILGVNIGKNKATAADAALTDYITALKTVYPVADYITANISSPNTPGLRSLQDTDSIKVLIDLLKETQSQLSQDYGYKPIVLKIAPDFSEAALLELAQIFKASAIDGVIATNTTIDKSAVSHLPHGDEAGGLSGRPLTAQSTQVIKTLSSVLAGNVPIIGVGGIMSRADAEEKIQAGASLVQLYTGLIYQGPQLISSLVNEPFTPSAPSAPSASSAATH